MPFLKQQIEIVNKSLLANAFADQRFAGGRFETIAVDASRKNDKEQIETFPAIMSENYEAQEITTDDAYPIVIYHKIFSKLYAFEKGQFGATNPNIVETSQVKMVVYGKYAKLKMTRESLEALITANFPDQIAQSAIASLKLDNMLVICRSSNLNSASVFAEEYKGFPLFLAPEDIYFSIRYDIETKFRKGCIKICDCN